MRKKKKQFKLLYFNGEDVRTGDKVLVRPNRVAIVKSIMKPYTKLARQYYVEKEGGFILQYEDGAYEVWMNTDDEIELIERSKTEDLQHNQ